MSGIRRRALKRISRAIARMPPDNRVRKRKQGEERRGDSDKEASIAYRSVFRSQDAVSCAAQMALHRTYPVSSAG